MPATKLLAVLTSDPGGPVVRHRWHAYAPRLLEAGVFLETVAWTKSAGARRFALQRASTADGVVVSSRLLGVRDVARLRRRARRLAFDFDDALPFGDSRRGARRSPTRAGRFEAICRAADRVFAGNPYLQNLAREAGAEAAIVPTTVHVPDGPAPDEPDPGALRIGWIGSGATRPYLEARRDALAALAAAGIDATLRVVADRPPALAGVRVDFVRWSPAGWEAALGATHVGVAPLPDDPWTRGKCGLKVLQTLGLGRPVVASAVGVQPEQVRHGETGLLESDDATFTRALVTLLTDGALRRRMGAAGREDVRAHWSVEAWAPRVAAHVTDLLS